MEQNRHSRKQITLIEEFYIRKTACGAGKMAQWLRAYIASTEEQG